MGSVLLPTFLCEMENRLWTLTKTGSVALIWINWTSFSPKSIPVASVTSKQKTLPTWARTMMNTTMPTTMNTITSIRMTKERPTCPKMPPWKRPNVRIHTACTANNPSLHTHTPFPDTHPTLEWLDPLAFSQYLQYVQDAEIAQVIDVLGLPAAAARLLLMQHAWSASQLVSLVVQDEGILSKGGVIHKSSPQSCPKTGTCAVCYDDHVDLQADDCGHGFLLPPKWSFPVPTTVLIARSAFIGKTTLLFPVVSYNSGSKRSILIPWHPTGCWPIRGRVPNATAVLKKKRGGFLCPHMTCWSLSNIIFVGLFVVAIGIRLVVTITNAMFTIPKNKKPRKVSVKRSEKPRVNWNDMFIITIDINSMTKDKYMRPIVRWNVPKQRKKKNLHVESNPIVASLAPNVGFLSTHSQIYLRSWLQSICLRLSIDTKRTLGTSSTIVGRIDGAFVGIGGKHPCHFGMARNDQCHCRFENIFAQFVGICRRRVEWKMMVVVVHKERNEEDLFDSSLRQYSRALFNGVVLGL